MKALQSSGAPSPRPMSKEIQMKRLLAACLLAACLPGATFLASSPAHAQLDSREAIQLNNQILELRRDMQSMREQMSRGAVSGGSSLGGRAQPAPVSGGSNEIVTSLLDRVAALEDQVRRLQGRIDESDNTQNRMGADLRKDIDDLNFKLGGAGATSPQSPPPQSPPPRPLGTTQAAPAAGAPGAPGAPPPNTPRRTPETAMQEGNAALARRDYATAEAAAREVLSLPRSPRATDAQFLLAQALSGKKDYAGAALAYDDTYNRAKTGSHAQDALVGLANTLMALNEKKGACVALDKLRTEFPNPRPDIRDAAAAARGRAACR
jgi:TolA-binding protein